MTAPVPDIIRPSEIRREPWANGGGTTRVLLRRPAWRVSIADIAGPSSFSSFEGMERLLIPLTAPGGLTLAIEGVEHVVATHEPIEFRGEDRVTADPGETAAQVVNIMTARRQAWLSYEIRRGLPSALASAAAVIVLRGPVTHGDDVLESGSVVLPPAHPRLSVGREGCVMVLRLAAPEERTSPASEP